MTTQADTAGTQPDRAGEHVPTAQDAHELVRAVVQGARLTHDQASVVFAALGAGDLSEAQTAALLAGLHARGEEAQEVAGAATAFRAAARAFPAVTFPLVDVVGTGGDGAGTINISTGAGLVAASMGISVAKHGNRAVSSRTGAADVIAELGLPLEVDPEVAVELLARDHFAFLFAQAYHPAMRHVAPVRRALATPTIFNVLGPLINPAHLTYQLMGVWDPAMLDMIARSMVQLGRKRALVVHGSGLDEIAVHGPTLVREATPRGVKAYEVAPADLGSQTFDLDDLKGGDPADNARLLHEALAGQGRPAHREAIAVNAGALLYLAGPADSLADGAAMAREQIGSGAVATHLESMTKATDLATDPATDAATDQASDAASGRAKTLQRAQSQEQE